MGVKATGSLLSREQILAASDLEAIEVPVPEWGGSVRIQAMSGIARDSFERVMIDAKSDSARLENLRAVYLSRCIVDANGELLFSADDVEALGKKSSKALDRCFDKAQELNAASQEDVEELEKN